MVLPTQRAPACKSCSTQTAFATAVGCEITPHGITATGLPTYNVDYVFNGEAQSVELTCSSGRQIERRHEGIALSDSDRGVFHSSWRHASWAIRDQSQGMVAAGDVEEKKVTVERRHSARTYFLPSTLSSHL